MSGDLRLISLTTPGDAHIWVDGTGSLVSVSKDTVQDPRTIDQLRNNVWSALSLTDSTRQQTALNESQIYQNNQYKTYWQLSGQFETSTQTVKLSDDQMAYYDQVYGAQWDTAKASRSSTT